MTDKLIGVLCIAVIVVMTFSTDWSPLIHWSASPNAVFKQVVYGLMVSTGLGLIYLGKLLWRKYVRRS